MDLPHRARGFRGPGGDDVDPDRRGGVRGRGPGGHRSPRPGGEPRPARGPRSWSTRNGDCGRATCCSGSRRSSCWAWRSRGAARAAIVHFASAVVGVGALFCLYEAGEHGGEVVYSYAGGVGLQRKDPADVGRLLMAGLYHQAQLDRKGGRAAEAAALIDLAARRFPDDVEVQLLRAESQLLDRKDPAAATAALAAITVPADNARMRVRHAIINADVLVASGQTDAARASCEAAGGAPQRRTAEAEAGRAGRRSERRSRCIPSGPLPAGCVERTASGSRSMMEIVPSPVLATIACLPPGRNSAPPGSFPVRTLSQHRAARQVDEVDFARAPMRHERALAVGRDRHAHGIRRHRDAGQRLPARRVEELDVVGLPIPDQEPLPVARRGRCPRRLRRPARCSRMAIFRVSTMVTAAEPRSAM